jgi:hypothetical protein
MLGTLVDRSDLTDRLARLIRVATTAPPDEITAVVTAAAIDPLGQTMEVDLPELGRRSSGAVRAGQTMPVRTEPGF